MSLEIAKAGIQNRARNEYLIGVKGAQQLHKIIEGIQHDVRDMVDAADLTTLKKYRQQTRELIIFLSTCPGYLEIISKMIAAAQLSLTTIDQQIDELEATRPHRVFMLPSEPNHSKSIQEESSEQQVVQAA